ncbi:hypothetical protein [Stanieria cyanosphaera]|uniref:hypothetical protein n=1 Tax=Stanieria cyanosphaera TaxID=102116 RepID=UPI0002E14BC6|nr:hypothetical protein [Stanieria cyanosphaera]
MSSNCTKNNVKAVSLLQQRFQKLQLRSLEIGQYEHQPKQHHKNESRIIRDEV